MLDSDTSMPKFTVAQIIYSINITQDCYREIPTAVICIIQTALH